MCVVTAHRSVVEGFWNWVSAAFLMLVNLNSCLTAPLFSLSRWVWCLHHCVFRERHSGAIYRRDCGRSDGLWVLGHHSNLVLLLIRRWCIGAGELAYRNPQCLMAVLCPSYCCCVVCSNSCFFLREGLMFYQHKKGYWKLIPFRFLLTKQFGKFEA